MTAIDRSPRQTVPAATGAVPGTGSRVPPLVLIYVVALFIPMGFTLGPLAMSPLRLYLLLVTPVLLVNLFRGRYGQIRLTDILFLLYLVWATIALAVNNPEMVVQNAGSTSMEFLGGYLVARAAIRDRQSFVGFCKLWGFVVALTILPVLFEQVTGTAILMAMVDALPGVKSIGDGSFMRNSLHRVQVAFNHPILYGFVCSTAISLTYVALKDEMPDTRRLLRTAIISICTFFSLSSGALLAMLLQFFMIGWAWALSRLAYKWLLLLVLMILAYITVDLLSTRTPMRVFLTYATFSAQTAYTRLYIFDWGMVNVWANPIFGLGFNDWVRPRFMSSSVDNFWLLTTMRYGIPAFLFLALGYFRLIWKVGRKDFGDDAVMQRLRLGWVFTMAGACFTLVTVHIWSGPFTLFSFLLGAGVWFLDASAEEGRQPAAPADDPPPESRSIYARTWLSDPARNRGRQGIAKRPKNGQR